MLFEKLTSATRKRVFLSMTPLEVLPKTVVIQQGDTEASMFYVLEAGACDALIANADGSGSKIVHQYKPGRHANLTSCSMLTVSSTFITRSSSLDIIRIDADTCDQDVGVSTCQVCQQLSRPYPRYQPPSVRAHYSEGSPSRRTSCLAVIPHLFHRIVLLHSRVSTRI